MVKNNHLTECRFMQTVRSQHITDAGELKTQFCEFDLLFAYLISKETLLAIILREYQLFVISYKPIAQ